MNFGGKNGRAVKVDVAVVAKGLASEQFFNDRDEEIGSLGDIVIDQKKAFRNT
jgi:hypothetical protein